MTSSQKMKRVEVFFLSSPIGCLKICIQDKKLQSISHQNKSSLNQKFLGFVDSPFSFVLDKTSGEALKKQRLSSSASLVKTQIQNYFQGKLKKFDIPLKMEGTDFQKKIWRSLQKISFGQTKTYGELARKAGVPGGARAVGNSCAKNPFLIVLPCHRVLAGKGLGGFALGLKAKKYLLNLERR